MSAPIQEGILVGGYYPAARLYDNSTRHANILFHDYYVERFKPLGLRRYEMMRMSLYLMRSDMLVGLDDYDYYEEENAKLTTLDIKPINNKYVKTITPDITHMSEKQQKRVDINGLSRWVLKIDNNVKELDDKEQLSDDINEICTHTNSLPMKRLEPIIDLCRYKSQKSRSEGKDRDINSASVVIEPLNEDVYNMIIPHVPINQSLPIDTAVTLKATIPFDTEDSIRKFVWTSNFKASDKIEETILKENPKSINLHPWLDKCHLSSIDLGSVMSYKFLVKDVDISIHNSYQMFRFEREADDSFFSLSLYYAFNLSPKQLIEKMLTVMPDNRYLKYINSLPIDA